MDHVEAYSRWHSWSINGASSQLTQVVSALDANLPAGWRRESLSDATQLAAISLEGSSVYSIEPSENSRVGVTLLLESSRPTQLKGGHVWFDGPPFPPPIADLPAAWDQVLRFLDSGIVPAANGSGVRVKMSSPAEVFLAGLPFEVRTRLQTFDARTGRTLLLTFEQAGLWHNFVVAAFRSRTPIDGDALRQWLVTQGWPESAASELTLRLYDQTMLLSRYAQEMSAV